MSNCVSCNKEFGWFTSKKSCEKCGKLTCSSCLVALVPEKGQDWNKAPVQEQCLNCITSSLNPTTHYGKSSDPLLVFLHGGGGTSKMFDWHAQQLSTRGYQCLLMDLPGHGANAKVPLSITSAIEYVKKTTDLNSHPGKPILIGGSLGGYLGMEFLGRYPDYFAGAVILMCGQAVGVDAGLAAKAGLIMMNMVGGMSGKTTMNLLRGQAAKNKFLDYDIVGPASYQAGMYFGQSKQQIQVLRETDPLTALSKFKQPVLFMNGALDHRDSELRWKAACQSELIVFPDTDHFFSHDKRYKDRVVDEIDKFSQKCFGTSKK